MATKRPRRPRLEIQLLGPPRVLVDGAPLAVDTRKAVAILALLGADARPFARDELAALLWPESDDAAAHGALRRTLSTMRTAIGDGPLMIDRSRVDLDRDRVRIDLADVEAAMHATDRATLTAAAALARGAFLAGFNLRDSPEFDDWRAARAVGAERAVLAVLDRLAEAAEAEGDLPAAIDAASRRLDLDPLDEGGHVRLMDLLVASGDRSAALRQYRACVATMERELGVEPLASTTARYEAIRDLPDAVPAKVPPPAARVSVAVPTPNPVAALPLVGRDGDLATIHEIRRAVATGGGRIVALSGEAGIGKTRLWAGMVDGVRSAGGVAIGATAYPTERSIAYGPIVELLRASLDLPDGRARLERLPRATRGELARLLPAIDPHADADPAATGPGAHARLVAAIADGLTAMVVGPVPGVVWIDDVQWLDAASREALDFLVRRLANHPLVLGLAWRPEDLDAEAQAFVERVAGLAATTTLVLGRLGRDEIAVLVDASTGGRTDVDLVDRLAVASEGLPLYVVEVLAAGPAIAPGSLPTGVRSVLRERLATAGETATQVLGAASVIGRSFDLATVRYASGRSEEETVDAIDEALRRGLIREAPAGYDFVHGALRDLAYEGISLARRRLLHRRIADALRLDLAGSGRDDLARMVLIATHERDAGRDPAAAEAYRAAGQRAVEVYANREAIEHFGAALALGHPDVAGLHADIGHLRTRLGEYDEAITALEAAAAAAKPAELPALEWSLARAHLRRGDLAAAEHHLDVAALGSRDPGLLARVWVDRSIARRRAGDPAGAATAAGEALRVADEAGDPVAAGAAHRMLGLAALDAGDPQAAAADLRRAVAVADEDADPTARVAALASLAMATAALGDVDGALVDGDEAVAACRRIGDRHLEAAVENHLADLLHAAGRDAEAMDHLHRAVAAFAEVGGDPADPDPGIWMLSAT